jgi:hypothetical protein
VRVVSHPKRGSPPNTRRGAYQVSAARDVLEQLHQALCEHTASSELDSTHVQSLAQKRGWSRRPTSASSATMSCAGCAERPAAASRNDGPATATHSSRSCTHLSRTTRCAAALSSACGVATITRLVKKRIASNPSGRGRRRDALRICRAIAPTLAMRNASTACSDEKEIAHEAVSRGPPISLCRSVARTHMYTHDAKVRALSLVRGPFSVALCQPHVTIRICFIAVRVRGSYRELVHVSQNNHAAAVPTLRDDSHMFHRC